MIFKISNIIYQLEVYNNINSTDYNTIIINKLIDKINHLFRIVSNFSRSFSISVWLNESDICIPKIKDISLNILLIINKLIFYLLIN